MTAGTQGIKRILFIKVYFRSIYKKHAFHSIRTWTECVLEGTRGISVCRRPGCVLDFERREKNLQDSYSRICFMGFDVDRGFVGVEDKDNK